MATLVNRYTLFIIMVCILDLSFLSSYGHGFAHECKPYYDTCGTVYLTTFNYKLHIMYELLKGYIHVFSMNMGF